MGPLFVGSLSDTYGRRPATIVPLALLLCVNIGLALQTSYPALMALRCLQGLVSSMAGIVCNSAPVDIVPRAERGRYMIYSSLGVTLGPAIGPILGGILTRFLGWRSIFWFLAILTAVMIVIMLVYVPETCRAVVGNGSIPPPRWNQPLVQYLMPPKAQDTHQAEETRAARPKWPSPLDSMKVAVEKETAAIILYSMLIFGGNNAVLSTFPSQLEQKYGFDALEIGLCYLPYGVGGITARWTVGKLIDWNFRRHAERVGVEVMQNHQSRLHLIPMEKARLQIAIPIIYGSSVLIVGYAWTMNYQVHLAGPIIMLFVLSHLVAGATSTLIALVVDCHVQQPGTAIAANNFFRSLGGAAVVAIATPLINGVGFGWMGTIVAFIWALLTPVLWGVYAWGHSYRMKKESIG